MRLLCPVQVCVRAFSLVTPHGFEDTRQVLHRAGDVPLRVLKLHDRAHALNEESGHQHMSAMLGHAIRNGLHILHADGTLEAAHSRAGQWLESLMERTFDAGLAGHDPPESRWPPGLELPAKDRLVEGHGSLAIIGVDREMAERIRHGE